MTGCSKQECARTVAIPIAGLSKTKERASNPLCHEVRSRALAPRGLQRQQLSACACTCACPRARACLSYLSCFAFASACPSLPSSHSPHWVGWCELGVQHLRGVDRAAMAGVGGAALEQEAQAYASNSCACVLPFRALTPLYSLLPFSPSADTHTLTLRLSSTSSPAPLRSCSPVAFCAPKASRHSNLCSKALCLTSP